MSKQGFDQHKKQNHLQYDKILYLGLVKNIYLS